jgi:ribosomal protein S18 acetylase RimI-like enzyme
MTTKSITAKPGDIVNVKIVPESNEDTFSKALEKFWKDADRENNASPRKESWGFLLYDENKNVIGGIGGYIRWEWLYISNLIVSKDSRRRGYGEQLIKHAEDFAKEKKLLGMHLLTLSFQAPDFYKKMGFVEYGCLENCPRNASLILLSKPLKGSS